NVMPLTYRVRWSVRFFGLKRHMGNAPPVNSAADRHLSLAAEIRRFDARMARLSDLGIDLRRPPRELLADLRARKEEMPSARRARGAPARGGPLIIAGASRSLHQRPGSGSRGAARVACPMPDISLGLWLGPRLPYRDRRRCAPGARGLVDEGRRQRLARR